MHPSPERDGARLMLLGRATGQRRHGIFRELPRLLRPRSLLVVNDTRVIPARLSGRKATGGGLELLLVRRTATVSTTANAFVETWEVLVRGLGSLAAGARISFDQDLEAELVDRSERGLAVLRFSGQGTSLLALADRVGAMPLPPYIEAARRRNENAPDGGKQDSDRLRYQTVYAASPGAVAAPTAGLHFTQELLGRIRQAGHEIAQVTLHVGPGTFRPVEADDPTAHKMDAESYEISEAAAAAVDQARQQGRPIVAVGTTVVRTLESAFDGRRTRPGGGSTNLFLLPGSQFHVVTDLVTNFHLPCSTLLMLVAAFAGREHVLAAYQDAVESGYRFYSYGDAMFVTPQAPLP